MRSYTEHAFFHRLSHSWQAITCTKRICQQEIWVGDYVWPFHTHWSTIILTQKYINYFTHLNLIGTESNEQHVSPSFSIFQPIKNHNKWNVLFFVAFLLLAGFVVLNMLVGVVVENFQKCRDIIEKDRMAEKEKEREKRFQSGKLIIPCRLLISYTTTFS